MTDAEQTKASDLREPPFEELYALYLAALAYDRAQMTARYADQPYTDEALAMILQPKSQERFREYLDECTRRGSRSWVVNCLVLGPAYCDAHPEDPRIRMPDGERAEEARVLAEVYAESVSGPRARPDRHARW